MTAPAACPALSDCAMLCQCGPGPVHRLQFSFRRGSLPPYIPLEHVACIGGCDTSLNEALDISLTPSTLSSLNNSTAGHSSFQLHAHTQTLVDIIAREPQSVATCCGPLILQADCRRLFMWLDTLP